MKKLKVEKANCGASVKAYNGGYMSAKPKAPEKRKDREIQEAYGGGYMKKKKKGCSGLQLYLVAPVQQPLAVTS